MQNATIFIVTALGIEFGLLPYIPWQVFLLILTHAWSAARGVIF